MSSLTDSVHRQSVSVQYSDYSSGEDVPAPEPSPEPTEDDDDSSSSSYDQIEANKQNTKKRVSQQILSKLSVFTSKDNDDENKEEQIKNRSRNDSKTSRSEKKSKLADRWLSKMNQSKSSLHESQKPMHIKEQMDFAKELKRQQIKQQNGDQKEENNVFKDCLRQHFVYDNSHILSAELICLYLREIAKIKVGKGNVLNDSLIEIFGDKVRNVWGYNLRLL